MKIKISILRVAMLTFLSIEPSDQSMLKNTGYGYIYQTRSQTDTYKQFFHLDDETFTILCKYIDLLKQQNKSIANTGSERKPQIFQNLMEYIKTINPIFHRNLFKNM